MTVTWRERRYCASNGHPDMWTEPEMARYGVHYCRHHCEVSTECGEEQAADPQEGVYAGQLWISLVTREDRRGKIIPALEQPKELSCRGCVPALEKVA